MAFSTDIKADLQMRLHVVEGLVDSQDMLESLKAFYRSPAYDPDMKALWDLRDATFLNVDASAVKTLSVVVHSHWGHSPHSKSALVVGRDLEFGFSRMFELNLPSDLCSQVRVFREIEMAYGWLGSN